MLVNCSENELIAYKTLSKYFIQELSFVPLHTNRITQTATKVSHKPPPYHTNRLSFTQTAITQTATKVGPYHTNRHQGWSKLHTVFTKLISKFSYLSQSAKIWC